jgi:nucleotide-binding universal stress UspA family protein
MKSLLIILTGGPQSEAALRSTVILQRALGARLIVAHPKPRLSAEDALASDAGAALAAIETAEDEHSTAGARQAFDAVFGGDPACRFRETHMTPQETLRKYSLFADLVVLARDKSEGDASLDQLKAALVANRAPTLWLPQAPLAAAPRTVVCVWNGQAPSARAIKMARPFLVLAEHVIIIEYAGDEVNHSRLEKYLDSHGVKDPVWRPYGNAGMTARGRARALMAEAKAAGADLLVMGAYGEIAESFFSFGRATEKVAQAAAVPVLFHS